MSLTLERGDLRVDSALIKCIPYGLALYYQVLPLAYEDDVISVAIAHPENATALRVLEDLLGIPVVPVRVSEDAMRDALRQVYESKVSAMYRVLGWCAHQDGAGTVKRIADIFAYQNAENVSFLTSDMDVETAFTVAREGQYDLFILHPPEDQPLAPLFSRSPASIFFVRDNTISYRRILMILRGYSSDQFLLDWLAPLLYQKDNRVTLLPLREDEATLDFHIPGNGHLRDLLNHPALPPGRTFIKFRQGQTSRQAVEEITQGLYDLVVIAAEGYGHFVCQVLSAIDQHAPSHPSAILILKPPVISRSV